MRQAVMYPLETIDFVKLDNDATGRHWALYDGEEPVSVISVFEQGEDIQFRKFATRKDLQQQGYGTRLLQHVFDNAIKENRNRIWCNARKTATALYEKFGMVPTGESWWKHGIEFIKMEKKLR